MLVLISVDNLLIKWIIGKKIIDSNEKKIYIYLIFSSFSQTNKYNDSQVTVYFDPISRRDDFFQNNNDFQKLIIRSTDGLCNC